LTPAGGSIFTTRGGTEGAAGSAAASFPAVGAGIETSELFPCLTALVSSLGWILGSVLTISCSITKGKVMFSVCVKRNKIKCNSNGEVSYLRFLFFFLIPLHLSTLTRYCM
jgi:hypothetical protein